MTQHGVNIEIIKPKNRFNIGYILKNASFQQLAYKLLLLWCKTYTFAILNVFIN